MNDSVIILVDGELNNTRYLALYTLIADEIANPETGTIILEFDSGGGVVGPAIADLTDLIHASPKPILGYINGMCGSAALWIASQCRVLSASRLSMVGSVGVFVAIDDTSAKLAREGTTVHVVATSPEKACAIEGAAVTEEALAEIRREIAYTEGQFHADLLRARPQLDISKVATGQLWGAHEALSLALIDSVASWDEFVATHFQTTTT